MDPKMDSGHLAPGETLDDDFNVLEVLLPEEIVGIMDQMLCYEVRHVIFTKHVSKTTCLMLIVGSIDGVADGISTFSNAIHFTPH